MQLVKERKVCMLLLPLANFLLMHQLTIISIKCDFAEDHAADPCCLLYLMRLLFLLPPKAKFIVLFQIDSSLH